MSKKTSVDPVSEKLDALLWVTQDVFVLQALQVGINAGDVRQIARVNMDRVSNISKYLKIGKGAK